mmetsp:Transcript_38004/g.113502  ORF Transcript_38004/g.113502 Transcript_38004/m.113502 type:complete len:191 (-) Transcript_38004:315-887(-)
MKLGSLSPTLSGRSAQKNIFEDTEGWEPEEMLLVSLAYSAAMAGATDALKFFRSQNGWQRNGFGNVHLDQKTGCSFLHRLVEVACSNPAKRGIVEGIRATLSSCNSRCLEGYHVRHRGSIGNPLHRAAARGHKPLVEALVSGGLRPSCPVQSGMGFNDGRDRGRNKYKLPEHWAQLRGHKEVVEFLRRRR